MTDLDTLLDSPRVRRQAERHGVSPLDYLSVGAQAHGADWLQRESKQSQRELAAMAAYAARIAAIARNRQELPPPPAGCRCNYSTGVCECDDTGKAKLSQLRGHVARRRNQRREQERREADRAARALRRPQVPDDRLSAIERRLTDDLRQFNRLHFWGRLPPMRVEFLTLDDHLGVFGVEHSGQCRVYVAEHLYGDLFDATDRERFAIAQDVVLHECIHAHLHVLGVDDEHDGRFVAECNRIRPRVSADDAAFWPHILDRRHWRILQEAHDV